MAGRGRLLSDGGVAPFYANVMIVKRLLRWLVCCAWLPTIATSPAVSIGTPAPAFALPDRAAHTVTLPSLRGKVVSVPFWASWCGPSRQSFTCRNALPHNSGAAGPRGLGGAATGRVVFAMTTGGMPARGDIDRRVPRTARRNWTAQLLERCAEPIRPNAIVADGMRR